jgi:hypothetical protein
VREVCPQNDDNNRDRTAQGGEGEEGVKNKPEEEGEGKNEKVYAVRSTSRAECYTIVPSSSPAATSDFSSFSYRERKDRAEQKRGEERG